MKNRFPRLNRRRFLGLAAIGAAATGVDALLWEPTGVKVRKIALGAGGPRRRWVHLTDIHYKGDEAYLGKVVDRVNALEPEGVWFTGDLIEEAKHLPKALEFMGRIRCPVYGVPGNHDYWSGADFGRIDEALARTGGRWLVDEVVTVGDGRIQIVGDSCVGDLRAQPRPGLLNVLMIHYPERVTTHAGQHYDLILAGHTHGGQVRLPIFGALVLPGGAGSYDLGMFQTPSGPMYVSPGIGWFYLPIRFYCRPEITVFEIA